MQIDFLSLLQQSPRLVIRQDVARLLLDGDMLLRATVVENRGENRVLLDVAGKLVEAQTTLALLKGQLLKLSVEQKGNETLLRIVTPRPAESSTQPFLRQVVAHQSSIRPLLMTLAKFDLPSQQLKLLPEPLQREFQQLQQVVAQLRKTVPQAEQLTRPATLRQTVQNSGHFFEARMAPSEARPTPPGVALPTAAIMTPLYPASDTKGLLLRLFSLMMRITTANQGTNEPSQPSATKGIMQQIPLPLPKSVAELLARFSQSKGGNRADLSRLDRGPLESLLNLIHETRGSLARIQTQQLTTLVRQESNETFWAFEIPLNHSDGKEQVLRMRVARDNSKGRSDAEKGWNVTLQIDDSDDNPIRIVVEFCAGQVDCHITAHAQKTAQLFNEQLTTLQLRLERLGFKTGNLTAHHAPIEDELPPPNQEIESLLNIFV